MAGKGKAAARAAKMLTRPIEDGVKKAEKVVAKDAADAAGKTASSTAAHTLTDADRAALRKYTGPAFRGVNQHFRDPAASSAADAARHEKFGAEISTALGKLPAHKGVVHRGGTFPEEVLQKYRPGQTVTEDAFTSTSTKKGFSGNVRFDVVSENGKYIAPYAEDRFKHQEEVLFDKGTKFQVLSHDVRNGKHHIVMKEVP